MLNSCPSLINFEAKTDLPATVSILSDVTPKKVNWLSFIVPILSSSNSILSLLISDVNLNVRLSIAVSPIKVPFFSTPTSTNFKFVP